MNTIANFSSQILDAPYTAWSDEDLIIEYRMTQNRDLFEELVKRYERELFNYLRYYTGDAETAEDIFQTTFLQVHLKCNQFDDDRKFRPWLYRIATNQAIDIHRKTKKLHVISADETIDSDQSQTSLSHLLEGKEQGPHDNVVREEDAVQVRNAVGKLPELLRQVLYLVYFQGMTYREASESLGVSFGTIKSRIHSAVKQLNNLLSDDTI
ncbi:MAG: RNA polymerase sigma factor [Thermoguttaceae bacterium]